MSVTLDITDMKVKKGAISQQINKGDICLPKKKIKALIGEHTWLTLVVFVYFQAQLVVFFCIYQHIYLTVN